MTGFEHLSKAVRGREALGLLIAALLGFGPVVARSETYVADPAVADGPQHYRNLVARLKPGDTLELPAGIYRQRLQLQSVRGAPGAWITITGPRDGPPAIITTDSTCCNAVQLGDTAYVAIKHLIIDANSEGVSASIDAVNAKGAPTHDILVEDCVIYGVGYHQATVGISTKSMAWNWTIRGNTVIEAGTGAYLGNSDGTAPFVAGIVENNLFVDTIGYNLQIKYQSSYAAPVDMPQGTRRTLIRHNVFLKRRAQSSVSSAKVDGPRPNLLVGGFPSSGPGADDRYEIYGNFFYGNLDGEAQIQASGRVSIHDNVLVGAPEVSIALRDHDLPLSRADVYNNTIYGGRYGIHFGSRARDRSSAVGNLVFAAAGITGPVDTAIGNIVAVPADGRLYVAAPTMELGRLNVYPLRAQAQGAPLDLTDYADDEDFDLDFNGRRKGDHRFRGAYAGEGTNPGWQLAAQLKPAQLLGVAPQ